MQTTTTYLFPQTVVSNGQYTGNAWNNPQNLLTLNGSYATTPPQSTLGSDVVLGNFLFNIPENSNIAGIEISFTGYRGMSASPATALQVYAYDNTDGNNFFYELTPVFSNFTTASLTYYFGSPSFLFNTTWTTDQINNLKIRLQANGELYVEGLQVRITYQPPGSGTPVNNDVCGSIFQAQPFSLISPISSNSFDTSWLVNRFQTSDGVPITNSDIVAPGIPITADQGTQNEENCYVTAVTPTTGTQSILTVTRGWSFRDPVTQSAPLRPHGSGAELIISNSVPFYSIFIRDCQIGSLVSAPISTLFDDTQITSYTRSYDFIGQGVSVTGVPNSGGGKDITVNIAGFSSIPPNIENIYNWNSGGIQVNTFTTNLPISGTDRYLLQEISMQSTQTITAMTYAGVAMTFLHAENRNAVRVELWGLIAPTLGTNSLVITLSGLSYIAGTSIQTTQTNQSTPFTFGTANSGNSGTSTGTVTTGFTNALVIHALATYEAGINYTAGGGESLAIVSLTGAVQGAIETQQVGTPATVTSNIAISIPTDWVNIIGAVNPLPTPVISTLSTENQGTLVDSNTIQYNFTGSGVVASQTSPGFVDVTVSGGSGTVLSVTGLNTDNTDPTNPIVRISVDGSTITGLGTPGSPLVSTGGGGSFGAWSSPITQGTPYLATTDGFCITVVTSITGLSLKGYIPVKTNTSSTPTIVRGGCPVTDAADVGVSCCVPVRNGDHVLVDSFTGTAGVGVSIYWLPL